MIKSLFLFRDSYGFIDYYLIFKWTRRKILSCLNQRKTIKNSIRLSLTHLGLSGENQGEKTKGARGANDSIKEITIKKVETQKEDIGGSI